MLRHVLATAIALATLFAAACDSSNVSPADNGTISGSITVDGPINGAAELQQALLAHPELFTSTVIERLLTYGLGRGMEYYDAPAIRQAAREAGKDDYRFSSVIMAVVNSEPFQMRMSK